MSPKLVHQYDIDGTHVQTFDSAQDAAASFSDFPGDPIAAYRAGERPVYPGAVTRACKTSTLFRGSVWSHSNPKGAKRVNQYSLDGKYLKTFAGASCVGDGAISPNRIHSVCKRGTQYAGGYIWAYYEDSTEDLDLRVNQCTRDGHICRTFISPSGAAKKLKINHVDITKACNPDNAYQHAGGFRWRYINTLC